MRSQTYAVFTVRWKLIPWGVGWWLFLSGGRGVVLRPRSRYLSR